MGTRHTGWRLAAVLALLAVGNTASAQRYYSQPSEPPAHYALLSGDCQSLNDALRTGRSRGLKEDTMNGLAREWRQRCAENDLEAREKYYEQVVGRRVQRLEDKRTQKVAERVTQQEQETKKAQCEEMLRILTIKRRRTDLTEGERNDQQRFESSYKDRCYR